MAEIFAIEHDGEHWKTVFPSKWAEEAHIHGTVADAAAHLLETAVKYGTEFDVPQSPVLEVDYAEVELRGTAELAAALDKRAKEVAVAAIFLFGGVQGVASNRWTKLQAFQINGDIGVALCLAPFALQVAEYIQKLEDFPGCFHYDVTTTLGMWLVSLEEASPEEFQQQLEKLTQLQIERYKKQV
jgi:hypothetical protein